MPDDNNTVKYWKGIEEYRQDEDWEEQKNHEFAEHLPIDDVLSEDEMNLKANRRDFLKYMGFTVSAATLAACTKSPVKKAVPYVEKPPEVDPGKANYYATSSFATKEAINVLIKSREGRPIKVEPNTRAPLTAGGTSATDQAAVLSLYDHTRLRGPVEGSSGSTWGKVDKKIRQKLQAVNDAGQEIAILTDTIVSPSVQSAINNFKQQYSSARHVQYDPMSQSAMLEANQQSFGKPYIPDYKFDQAKAIVGINADFLGTWVAPTEFTYKYTQGRKVDKFKDMSFHVQFESHLSLTGSNADLRAPIKPSQEGAVLVALYNRLAKKAGVDELPESKMELAANALKMTADELWKDRGKAIVVSGTNDLNTQLLTNRINALLNNYGNTISFKHASRQKQGDDAAVDDLINDMKSGKVGAVLMYGPNPVYSHPRGEEFQAALENLDLSVSLNSRNDETTQQCGYRTPDHHFLESWNDAQPKLGYFHISQPTISPIFNTRGGAESLLRWAGSDETQYDFIRRFWNENLFKNQNRFLSFRQFWNHAVHDGFFADIDGVEPADKPAADTATAEGTTFKAGVAANIVDYSTQEEGSTFNQLGQDLTQAANELIAQSKDQGEGYEVVLYEKVGIRDGAEANNPWLQELPDPVTRTCWDNYAAISPKLAEELGLQDEDVINISAGGRELSLPTFQQPGQPYGTIAVAVGYGHFWGQVNGKVADGVGQNAYPFVQQSSKRNQYHVTKASVNKTGRTYPLAKTQTHHHMEGRDLIYEAPMGQYLEDPKSVEHHSHHVISLYKDYNYNRFHHWAMAIDLNACTGCGACVVSCQAENNVPVVGKQEVRRRREMHWIRIDRYYSGDPENPSVNFQPLMCQHCDNAPCENVCPVAAINHSDGGLNQQVYNRCVGTRYCANNCPYKVRRFNWFKYGENDNFDYNMNSDLGRMVLNPDVTVRSRGVMEKCSFCVQRIQKARLDAKTEGKELKDGEVKTACQTACPANAIVFGDLNDPESEVAKLVHENHRSYGLLTEIGTKPSVNYMTKIRNRRGHYQEDAGGHNSDGGHA
jgi:molybdopterin-containing oxidoreductase family iron-sulfur binding subunit